MIRNTKLARLTAGGAIASWRNALAAGFEMKHATGASWGDLIRAAQDMRHHGGLKLAEAMRAAAAPMLIQRAVVSGDGDGGLMATGQVAGRLCDLPSVADLLRRIESEARARLVALGAAPRRMTA
jgi:hypothetical protein